MDSIASLKGSDRWVLAERLTRDTGLAKQCLTSISQGILESLQEQLGHSIDPAVLEDAKAKVAQTREAQLVETLIASVVRKVLGSFEDEDIEGMLAEHKSSGSIQTMRWSVGFQVAHQLNRNAVQAVVMNEASGMSSALVTELVSILEDKGVDFSQLRKAPQGEKSEAKVK